MGTNNNVLANGGFGSPWSPGLIMLCLGARLGNQQQLASGAAGLKEAHRLPASASAKVPPIGIVS